MRSNGATSITDNGDDVTQQIMSFGKSFLDLAEAMNEEESLLLGKQRRFSSSNVLNLSSNTTNLHYISNIDEGGKNNNDDSFPSSMEETKNVTTTTEENESPVIGTTTASNNDESSKGQNQTLPITDDDSCCLTKIKKRKSVVIIDAPTTEQLPLHKKQRIMGNYSASDVVQALNAAMSQEERKDAMDNAMATFDHHIRDLHDREIEIGADVALIKTIMFIIFKAGFCKPKEEDINNTKSTTIEITMILEALECVYRASSNSVGRSFDRVGTELLGILVSLIDHVIAKKTLLSDKKDDDGEDEEEGEESEEGDESDELQDKLLKKATKVLGHLARVGRATLPLASFPGFLNSLVELIDVRPYSLIPNEARLTCLWIIANLACNKDNMATMMFTTPNLIESIVSIMNRRVEFTDTVETIMEILRGKSIACRMVLNLSWLPRNNILMSQNHDLIETLSTLAVERRVPFERSKTMQDVVIEARRHSLASLRNIAGAVDSKITLCSYNDGKLLDVLTDVLVNDTDQHCIDLSLTAVYNLTSPETAERIVDRHPDLVLALKNIILVERQQQDDDVPDDDELLSVSCQRASATIKILEETITETNPRYVNLKALLLDEMTNPNRPSLGANEEANPSATAAIE